MNMIYRNDTLYVDIFENDDLGNMMSIKRKIFSIIDQYQVDNVVINLKNKNNVSKGMLNSLICDYHKNYRGNIIVDIK